MSHELEIREGRASFAFNVANGDPWHQLGTPIKGYMTIEQALVEARANFEVIPCPATALTPAGIVEVPDRMHTFRHFPGEESYGYLGTVGSGYQIVQNPTVLERAYDIVGASEGSAHLDTLGVLYDGQRLFSYIRLDDLYLDPTGINDKIERGLAIYWSHDGSVAVTYAFSDTRAVCKNTITFAVEGASRILKARHTASVEKKIEKKEAQAILGVSTEWAEKFTRQAESLMRVKYTPVAFDKVINRVFPLPKDATDRQKRNTDEVHTTIRSLFVSETNSAGFGASGWTMFNAIGEYLDHAREGKPDDKAIAAIMPGSWTEKKKQQAAVAILSV